jgi:hypothetical protein
VKKRYKNGFITAEALRDLLVDHYISQPCCNWNAIVQISSDFGYSPLNAIRIHDDKRTSIKPIIRLLRQHEVYCLHIERNDEFTHTITIMNHTTEN